jgi:molybdopterin converting factor small subunit
MKVNVLFFGATAEAAGQKKIEFETADGRIAGEVFQEILDAFPALKEQGRTLLFSVNQEYASGSETVREGDELAVFTPVSGG